VYDSPVQAANVFVIDDEPQVVRVLSYLLEDNGYVVRSAGSAETGLRLVEAEQPELIVLDLSLPGMSGDAFLPLLRSRWPDIVIICITAWSSDWRKTLSARNGAFDYLVKPFDNDQLLLVIKRALAARSFATEQGQAAQEIEAQFGSPALPEAPDPVQKQLASAQDFLSDLSSLIIAAKENSKEPLPASALKYRLLNLIIGALTARGELYRPVFWALARSLRVAASATSHDAFDAANHVHQMTRNAVELVRQRRPNTRALVGHIEAQVRAANGRLTLNQFCKTLGLNRTYVSRLLGPDTGLNFRQWRWAILMAAAVRRLATSNENIRQIAFSVGYEHAGQFDRDFARAFGMSPAQFRRLAQV